MEARLLIVEDDERIGTSLRRAFASAGYDAIWAATGAEAKQFIEATTADAGRVDLVLLDLGLPDADGLDVCRWIVEHDPMTSVIMVTARDEELDVVVGLDAGAVDYVTKPFSLATLQARVRAQLRHRTPSAPPTPAAPGPGDLQLDVRTRIATLHGAVLHLRAKEFDLLARLAADRGAVVTREALMSDVWDEHWAGSTKTLDFHIGALRAKLDRPAMPSMITTIRGVGFRLEAPESI